MAKNKYIEVYKAVGDYKNDYSKGDFVALVTYEKLSETDRKFTVEIADQKGIIYNGKRNIVCKKNLKNKFFFNLFKINKDEVELISKN